jgi:UDP-N-acetylmuramoyl-tripeptide--D-alanyl-D-alanine ligase
VGAYADALRRVAPAEPRAVHGADPDAAWSAVRSRLAPDAVILLKGSRGVRLERLIPLIADWAASTK